MHCHAYRKPVPFVTQFCTPAQVITRYDEAHIERGVLLPIVSPEIYLPQANEDILEMAEQFPDRFIPWCNVDPRALTYAADAPLHKLLDYYKKLGCKGVGEIMLNVPVLDPMVQNLFKHAQDVGLPVTFDGSDRIGGDFGLYDEPGLPQLEHTLQRFPDLLILGHGPLFWAEIGQLETPGQRKPVFKPDGTHTGWRPQLGPIKEEGVMPKLLRLYPNLHAEMSDGRSAIARDPNYGPNFLTEFQDRLYFGTDLCHFSQPMNLLNMLLEWRDSQKISHEVFNKITRLNAIKLMGLKETNL